MNIQNFDELTNFTEQTVLVLGYFDGLHRGHQAVFAEARRIATVLNLKIAVLTFPERAELTFKQFHTDMLLKLTSDKKREALFEANGVDFLFYKPLTSKFAACTSSEFVENFCKKLNPKVIVTGFDYTTGSDMVNLKSTDEIRVVQVPELKEGNEKISSTRIRDLIKVGEVAEANSLLGYEYETTGIVVHGFKRGREIGYPTANLVIKDYIHIPAVGVYTVDVIRDGKRLRGFASIGYNDTFEGVEKTIEVNVFDFNEQLYGENLTVLWLDRIRGMVKFDGMETLIEQMKKDEIQARNF
ncbi:bifunctional riboflavin kinase/FAD synthetase [Lactovum miscens]|uniref:Riboflavin biosynthesis protein n=1 Tax=Lactovum miscens TaxID=190387 RepID=A0A841CB51_9LACT|nr:bifunctional riboflavin kinase/FAD synthetase [Lactovum miscens]MBB5888781.1 riboflavin kinase/FMN adenylyltransferase [Lactovum miscens]